MIMARIIPHPPFVTLQMFVKTIFKRLKQKMKRKPQLSRAAHTSNGGNLRPIPRCPFAGCHVSIVEEQSKHC